ncbi:hypothetical protein ACHWQZ_G000516 [Mnemiopsis leidyi]
MKLLLVLMALFLAVLCQYDYSGIEGEGEAAADGPADADGPAEYDDDRYVDYDDSYYSGSSSPRYGHAIGVLFVLAVLTGIY